MTQNEISKIKKIIKKYWNDQPSSSLRIIISEFLKKNDLSNLADIKFITKNMRLKYFKIPSSEIYSIDILKFISKKKKKIILSTGMSNMKDISACIKELNKKTAQF